MAEAQELTTYKANCHCGAVRFTVRLPDLRAEKINSCNCSICTKNGYLLAYPQASDVVFLAGEDILKAYRFGNRDKPHRFCSECGTSILIDFSESPFESERQHTAVNIRCFVGIEDVMAELKLNPVNGKAKLNPPYQVPEF